MKFLIIFCYALFYTLFINTIGTCLATNCWWAALLGGGEAWHNNHHMFALCANHGFFKWWEFDASFLFICLMGELGVITDVIVISKEVTNSKPESTDYTKIQNLYTVWYQKEKDKQDTAIQRSLTMSHYELENKNRKNE